MKQILGDNQFFGVNHHDIEKGERVKSKFASNESIINFIEAAVSLGLDGFMINSNSRGYDIISTTSFADLVEIHYSVPYPHKFATMVNESGMFALLKYIINNSSLNSLFLRLPTFFLNRDIKNLLPLILDLEIPKNLKRGSYVYLQNIVTDLLLGIHRFDLIEEFCNIISKKGYKPGLITLNPILLDNVVVNFSEEIQNQLILCFNINISGFNVFPSKNQVEELVFTHTKYKKMGMSVLSSGGAVSILESLEYVKAIPLDYVVYGSSNLNNIENNFSILNSK